MARLKSRLTPDNDAFSRRFPDNFQDALRFNLDVSGRMWGKLDRWDWSLASAPGTLCNDPGRLIFVDWTAAV